LFYFIFWLLFHNHLFVQLPILVVENTSPLRALGERSEPPPEATAAIRELAEKHKVAFWADCHANLHSANTHAMMRDLVRLIRTRRVQLQALSRRPEKEVNPSRGCTICWLCPAVC
jgi:hypothetical protein